MSIQIMQSWRDETSVTFEAGRYQLSIQVPNAGIMRIIVSSGDERPSPTPAVVLDQAACQPIRVDEEPDAYRVASDGVSLRLGKSGLRMIVQRYGDAPLVEFCLDPLENGWEIEWTLSPQERIYGLGERTGYLDKRGRTYVMWNTDDPSPHIETLDPMYVSIPWMIGLRDKQAYGLYLDDPTFTTWDMGESEARTASVTTARPSLDIYLVMGPRLSDVVERYTALTGKMTLPPRWALGFQQSRYSYETADRMREVAREFRDREIPCDVLYADIHYMHHYRVFTWHPEHFPDPASLISELAREGFKIVPIIDPGVKKDGQYEVFKEGVQANVYTLDHDGFPYIGEVWPGKVAFPDFVRPEVRHWWGERHQPLFDAGVAGIWNDMNEPAVFDTTSKTMPLDNRHGADGSISHTEVHNLYGYFMGQATYEALSLARPGMRPFVLSRAGFAGIQRIAAVWTGDNFSIWPHLEQALPMAMNLSLSGVSFVGPDVGGFSGDCSGELLARWTQLGAFTPFFRNHTAIGTRHQEPWTFGSDIEEICRRYIQMRYQWLPYLYTAFWRCHLDGTPIMRPLIYDYQDDAELELLYDQCLVGPSLMIAPVYQPSARRRVLYLPDGIWWDYWRNLTMTGPMWFACPAPLDQLPMFVKAGAVICTGPWAPSTEALKDAPLTIEVYPGETLAGEWFDDDGESVRYQQGDYQHWQFTGESANGSGHLEMKPVRQDSNASSREVALVIRGLERVRRLTFNGSDVDWERLPQGMRAVNRLEPGVWAWECET